MGNIDRNVFRCSNRGERPLLAWTTLVEQLTTEALAKFSNTCFK